MALNSWQFITLAVVAVVLLPVAPRALRTGLFLVLNLTFAWTYWGPAAMPLALGFCLVGYVAARAVERQRAIALVGGVGLLVGAFVYLRGYSVSGLTTTTGPPTTAGVLAFAGLSFLFFKTVHVVVDTAGGTAERLRFWSYLNYCTNFTTLLMGPIQRYQDFVAQWNAPAYGTSSFEQKIDATNRVLRGLVKAFALAPWLQFLVIQPGLNIEALGAVDLLTKVYSFYIYLYLDFSGYCDIMIGIGTLMGVRPPENFRFPFLAPNVSEYWLRVHRSLTLWLTDYVFTPSYRAALTSPGLGRYPFVALAVGLILTMLVAGVWHGTTLNFVMFGLIHGIALVVFRGYEHTMSRLMGRDGFRRFRGRAVVSVAAIFVTYNFTSLAYTFFALNVDESMRVFSRLMRLATEGMSL